MYLLYIDTLLTAERPIFWPSLVSPRTLGKSEQVIHLEVERETGGGNNGPLHHPFLGC